MENHETKSSSSSSSSYKFTDLLKELDACSAHDSSLSLQPQPQSPSHPQGCHCLICKTDYLNSKARQKNSEKGMRSSKHNINATLKRSPEKKIEDEVLRQREIRRQRNEARRQRRLEEWAHEILKAKLQYGEIGQVDGYFEYWENLYKQLL